LHETFHHAGRADVKAIEFPLSSTGATISTGLLTLFCGGVLITMNALLGFCPIRKAPDGLRRSSKQFGLSVARRDAQAHADGTPKPAWHHPLSTARFASFVAAP